MPKNQCCCKTTKPPFCCNPVFYKEFITLFGDSMAEHAEVSPDDWVALYVTRPSQHSNDVRRWFKKPVSCNCCCGGCPGGNDGGGVVIDRKIPGTNFLSSLNKFKNILTGTKSSNSDLTEDNGKYNNFFMDSDAGGPDTGNGNQTCNDGLPVPCNVDAFAWCAGHTDVNDPVHDLCRTACCTEDRYRTQVAGAEPIFFAYKYSGCNLKWYPREFSFGKDPYVPQCNGFLTIRRSDQYGIYVSQNSCSPFADQRPYAGAAFNNFVEECSNPFSWDRQTDSSMPCACTLYPHIHGGVRDSIFNRVNVSISSGELGYLPYMFPLMPGMETINEAGCCWCASSANPDMAWDQYKKNRNATFASVYPFVDQQGKIITQTATVGPGANCYYAPNNSPGLNPNYRRSCYEWGISPYLMRISKDNNKMAYSIWRHGRNPDYYHDFGPTYIGTRAYAKQAEKDWDIKFTKVSGKKTTLKQQYIGFIQLEHNFECYAYRSDSGSNTATMMSIQNNGNMLIPPFERGYAGTFTPYQGQFYRWSPYMFSSSLWQIRRGVPRRVMYTGSGIPLFHFDLVAMENLCKTNENIVGPGGTIFSGETFLEHYNRYFYSMIFYGSDLCPEEGALPEPLEFNFVHLLNSYEYVVGWLELMIEHGILRIKDHAIDISSDVNKIIKQGGYITNEEGKKEIVVASSVALETGGVEGYKAIIDLFGVCAGQENATTPKMIKNALLNLEGTEGFTGPSGDRETFRCFLPRRARLQLSASKSGLTGWGCSQSISPTTDFSYDGISCASYINESKTIPPKLLEQSPESIFSNLNPIKVFCGLGATFVLDRSGKLLAFGGIPNNGDSGTECEDEYNGSYSIYPSSVICIPWYLDAAGLFVPNNGELVLNSPMAIPDGNVIDLTFTSPNFVSTLVDFNHRGVGLACAYTSNPTENPSFETGEMNGDYQTINCNGSNVGSFVSDYVCMKNEPFQIIQFGGGAAYGPRSSGYNVDGATLSPDGRPLVPTYRIKSWGSMSRLLGTFSLAKEDAKLNYPTNEYRGYDEGINPNNLRYPGPNNWFIWTAIASGMMHFAALDDYGGVFITSNSSNEDGQATKGIPLAYDSIYNSNPEMGWSDMYHGWESHFNYFNHIPRPGFIYEGEWTQELYNSLTWVDSNYKKYLCSCPYTEPNCHPSGQGSGGGGGGGGGGGQHNCVYTEIRVKDENGDCVVPNNPVYDSTCILMGSYVQEYASGGNRTFSKYQPRYTQLAAGHYNTMLLTNENRVEIYGKYYQIDQDGNKIGPKKKDDFGNEIIVGITAFVPEDILSLQGSWDLTHGCTFECDGAIHRPIISYNYTPPSNNALINTIKSSCDYSVCVTNGNQVHIWGDASIIPGKYDIDTYIPGKTAYTLITLPGGYDQNIKIKNIALGVNSFYIHYSLEIPGTNFETDKIYSYTRYGKQNFGTQVPNGLQGKPITDVSSGYNFAIAIYSDGLEAKAWDYNSFAPGTKKYQYKNFDTLPPYFKRDAYFHAIPGSWDYSRWLYGGNCCGKLTDPDHPILQQDRCASLAYNIYDDNPDTNFNKNLSYSGNPKYFWMKTSWRRFTPQALTTIKDVAATGPTRCDPDGGYGPGGEGNEIARMYGSCLSDVGSVWAESRPMAAALVRNIQTPIEPRCIQTNDDCVGELNYHNNGIIPPNADALSRDYNFPTPNAYRSTKDVFQNMIVRYESDVWPSTDNTVPCAKHKSSVISYFKYSERHYYFGYDRETDTYDIYLNPDFMRNIGTNGLGWTGPDPGGYTAIIQLPQNGFGGGTGPNGGTLAGICGYYSLYKYPMTGINYGREDWNYFPLYVVRNQFILTGIISNICRELLPDGSCYTCGKPPAYQALAYFGGPGAYAFMPPCGNYSSVPPPGDNIYTMWNAYRLYLPYYQTLSPKVLLNGIDSVISQTIPPESDPSFVKYTFSDVLKNEYYTEKEEPWYYPNSTKWIPLFMEPPDIMNFGGANASDGTFPTPSSNLVIRKITDTGVIYLSTPFLCNIMECCAPPEG